MSKVGQPELSIVMPVFNRKELVHIMIESIIANTYQDWELLAIDDGSTDGAYEMLCELALKDKRVKPYVRTELPKGAQTCRNKGLEQAKGEYVVFFDSDDYVSSSCLQTRIEFMKKNPQMDFLIFPFGSYENKERNIYKVLGGVKPRESDIDRFLCRRLPFMVWTNIYKTKTLIDKKLLWDNHLLSLQDADFNLMAILSELKYAYVVTDVDYFIRLTNNGQSVSKKIVDKEYFESHLYAIKKWYVIIHERYGKRKNKKLFLGVLWLYNQVSMSDCAFEFAYQLSLLLKQYDLFRAYCFKLMIWVRKVLHEYTPMSANLTRRIVFFPYLLRIHILKR